MMTFVLFVVGVVMYGIIGAMSLGHVHRKITGRPFKRNTEYSCGCVVWETLRLPGLTAENHYKYFRSLRAEGRFEKNVNLPDPMCDDCRNALFWASAPWPVYWTYRAIRYPILIIVDMWTNIAEGNYWA